VTDALYYLGFSAFSGIGPKRLLSLLYTFGSPQAAWEASQNDVEEVLGKILSAKFEKFRNEFSLSGYASALKQKDIQYVTWERDEYPILLKTLIPKENSGSNYLPPFVLYVKGDIAVLQAEKTIGVVGTRKVTDYGREVTEHLTKGLVERGFLIVSGLALGVDGISHSTAIENNGKTIAVLGSSVDFCTPAEHQKLYEQILSGNGCIVSQFALGENVGRGNFPARNTIIAGISQGILVTEGAEDSGSLLTAQDAQKLGRPVFSVPGPITSYLSKGTNNLIKQGVTPILEVSDIIKALNYSSSDGKSPETNSFGPAQTVKGDTKEEQEVIDILKNESLQFDEIVRRIGKDSKTVGSLLSLLELKGIIKTLSNGNYSLKVK